MPILLTENQAFKQKLLMRLGTLALRIVKPFIHSRTLKARISLDFDIIFRSVRLRLPHYWAQIHHDGRGQVAAKPGGKLVWYPDIRNDPRVAGGLQYPIKKSQRRKLSREDFRKGVEENKKRPKNRPFMVISDASQPSRAGKNYPFFAWLDAAFVPEARRIVPAAFRAFIKSEIRKQSSPQTAKIRL